MAPEERLDLSASAKRQPEQRPRWLALARRFLVSDGFLYSLVAIGILLRVVEYARNRALWFDEALYALQLSGCRFEELLRPVGALTWPVCYALVQKPIVTALGMSEYGLRLLPFISGVASTILMLLLARRVLARAAVPVATGLFAISVPLVYFSTEFKPYSFDVALTLLILFLADGALEVEWTTRRSVLYALGGAACIWLSHGAMFVLGGVGIVFLIHALRRPGRRNIVPVLVVLGTWFLSVVSYYVLFAQPMTTVSVLRELWGGGFMPFPPRSARDFLWPIARFHQFLRHPAGLVFPTLGALAFIVGCISLGRRSPTRLGLLIAPLALVWLAAALGKYPIRGRTVLFLTPVAFSMIASGVAWALERSSGLLRIAVVAAVALLFAQAVRPGDSAFWQVVAPDAREKPHPRADPRPALVYMRDRAKPGDVIYIYRGSWPVFDYYAPRYGLGRGGGSPYRHVYGTEGPSAYRLDLPLLRGHRRVWVLLSRVWEWNQIVHEHEALLAAFDAVGDRLDSFVRPGVRLYLYDLSPKETSVTLPSNLSESLLPSDPQARWREVRHETGLAAGVGDAGAARPGL